MLLALHLKRAESLIPTPVLSNRQERDRDARAFNLNVSRVCTEGKKEGEQYGVPLQVSA